MWRLTSAREPTGTAVTVNSRTTPFRMSCLRSSISPAPGGGAVDRPAVPVGLVVVRAAAGPGPAGDLVALVAGPRQRAVGGVELLPLPVLVHLRQPAALAAPGQQRARLERQAVAGQVLRAQRR